MCILPSYVYIFGCVRARVCIGVCDSASVSYMYVLNPQTSILYFYMFFFFGNIHIFYLTSKVK